MKSKSGKLLPFLAGMLAILLFVYSVFHSETTTAASSFAGNLPPNYKVYPGQLVIGKACTCSTASLSGSPPPPPPCNTNPCFGSSNTRYAWVSTNSPGINSTVCQELKQSTKKAIPPCFQLDGDDALVILGSMAPAQNSTYYGFAFYQSLIYNPNTISKYFITQNNVNLGFNNKTLNRGSDGKYALIVGANTLTVNLIKRALLASGVPVGIMNTYLVPASITNLGSADYPDQLSFLLRLTPQGETEKNQVNTFVEQTAPNTKIAFVKGPGTKGDVTVDDIPNWADTLRANSVEYSTGLNRHLKALQAAVTNRYIQKGYKLKARLNENLAHSNSDDCTSNPRPCVYNSQDALYSSFPCSFSPTPLKNGNCNIQLGPYSNDVLMWLGVDHSLVGDKTLAAYFSEESKILADSKDGTFSFIGLYTQGSANQYLPRRRAANLYAVKITRDCGSELYCVAVPPYQGGTSKETGFYVVGRTYLDKVTGSGPNPANLVPSVILWFTKS